MRAYESELRAIVRAVSKRKLLIGNQPVTVKTDHATLSRISRQNQVTRLCYWFHKSADFDLSVVYKPGTQNVVADAISRHPDFVGVTTRGRPGRSAAQKLCRGDSANFHDM